MLRDGRLRDHTFLTNPPQSAPSCRQQRNQADDTSIIRVDPNDNDPARQLLTKVTETANKTRPLDETLTPELSVDNHDKIPNPSKVDDLYNPTKTPNRRQCYSHNPCHRLP